MARILIADDEPKLAALVAESLELDGHAVVRAGGGKEALARLAAEGADVVVTDLKMPEVDGLAVLRAARALPDPPEVVLMTAFATAQSAVEAMKAGAADYVTKPFSMEELRLRVRRLAERRAVERREGALLARLTPALVAESAAMQAALAAAARVAPADATVLLLGESGTGKSQLARWIHYRSRRAAAPLVEVHCAAFPETLLEGELFGHEKGAFTGASQRKAGHLAAADGGTLFLDEIGEVSASIQVKLLRFLQDRAFVPLGATEPRRVDARVVAATNRDLDRAVQEGAFREDFYYRLNVFAIRVPPLRERREDVLPIAERFLAARGIPAARLSAGAREALLARTWPGNVRELENALERALILAGDEEVRPEHLGPPPPPPGRRRIADLLEQDFDLDAFEREIIEAALARTAGNKSAAARLLGITRRRLYSRLEILGLRPPGGEDDAGSDA
jgi:DNA-binding NtrC family response regulator